MPNKIFWELQGNLLAVDKKLSTGITHEADYKFKITRWKNKETFEEALEIESLYKDNDNGSITTTIANVHTDLPKLALYGVAFDGNTFGKIANTIEKEYMNLNIKYATSETDDTRQVELIQAISDYVRNDKGEDKELCHVPVTDFNDLAMDYGYGSYELTLLRKKLSSEGYIRTIGTRSAVLARIGGRPTRVLSFFKNKLLEEKAK